MEAIRRKIKRTGNKLIIELPEDFIAEEIEMIIFPYESSEERNSSENETDNWRKFSINNLERAYGEDEPDYSNVLLKESNPKYSI
ncbi:MAG: hypothetical protein M3R36_01000 [Bacteroidota bacterium]|nr:hypothetical protein [Bacteroidota bacterium]